MNLGKICRAIAAPCMLVVFFITLGIVGAIERGESIHLAWWAIASIGALWLVLLGAQRG